MTRILDLPEPLTQELREEAIREGISLTDHATLMLYVATALHDAGKANSPFQQAIKDFFASRSLDPHQLSSTLDELLLLCAKAPQDSAPSHNTLTQWRDLTVHRPAAANTDIVELRPDQSSSWPANFFEETYGSETDAQIERLPQGAYPTREPVE